MDAPPPVTDARVRARRRGQKRPKRLIDGVAVGHEVAGAVGHGGHVAQVVGVEGVVSRRAAALPDPLGDDLAVGAEGDAAGDGGVRAAGNLLLVVGEGRVDARRLRPVRLVDGQDTVAAGVVFGCSGAGRRSERRLRIQIKNTRKCCIEKKVRNATKPIVPAQPSNV